MMKLHVGSGHTAGALTVFPVWGEYGGPRGYGSDMRSVVVGEREDGPSVPVLVATNGGERPVLMLEGQLLEGGWQSRTLVRSVLVPAGSRLDLDVACVEAGRWEGARAHRADGRRGSVRVRSALSRAIEQDRQGEVWRRVAEYDARHGADGTGSFAGHLDRASQDVERLICRIRALPGQSGVVIGIAGQPAIVEVFDSPLTLRREYDSIIRAAAMDAIGAEPVPTPSRRARRLVDRATQQRLRVVADAGLGRTVRGRDQYAEVSGLAWRSRLVHTTFTNVRHPLFAGAVA